MRIRTVADTDATTGQQDNDPMLYAMDLTQRQARRVMEQALRAQARVEIEPRNFDDDAPLCGRLTSHDGTTLRVELDDDGRDTPLITLVGACCDVRVLISDQVYLFNTTCLDSADAAPRRITLGAPEAVQVGNRRQYVRRVFNRRGDVRITTDDALTFSGLMTNLGSTGSAVRVPRERDGVLLVGEGVRLQFAVGETDLEFDLRAIVCHKTLTQEREALSVGFQFVLDGLTDRQAHAIERLRAFLSEADAGEGQEGDE